MEDQQFASASCAARYKGANPVVHRCASTQRMTYSEREDLVQRLGLSEEINRVRFNCYARE
jgi:hypothetical protein